MSLLGTVKEEKLEVFLWRFVGGSKHMATVKIESVRKSKRDFCVIPAEGHSAIVQEVVGSLNYIDVYVPESALLMRCTIKHTDAPVRYYLEIPTFVAQVDRRKSFRLNVHDDSEMKLNFIKMSGGLKQVKQQFLKNCFDISTGGFSFLISKAEFKLFKVAEEFLSVDLKTKDWSGKGRAQVSAIREVEPDDRNGLTYKVFRVSCSFTQLDQGSQKYLEKYIFERIKDELRVINE